MPKATGVYKASNGTWYFKLFTANAGSTTLEIRHDSWATSTHT